VPSLVILVSPVLVLSCGQTDRQTESHIGLEVDDRDYCQRETEYTHRPPINTRSCVIDVRCLAWQHCSDGR